MTYSEREREFAKNETGVTARGLARNLVRGQTRGLGDGSPQRVQRQNMETLENTNGAVTKTDLQWHAPGYAPGNSSGPRNLDAMPTGCASWLAATGSHRQSVVWHPRRRSQLCSDEVASDVNTRTSSYSHVSRVSQHRFAPLRHPIQDR